MEGDAGASRLNPIDEDESTSAPARSEDSQESESEAGQTSTVTDADSTESESAAESTSTAADEDSQGSDEDSQESGEEPAVVRGKSRVGRAWLAGIAAVLLISAAAIAGGGYYALRSHQDIAALQRNDTAALNVAKDCVAATQAPDISSMAASEQKIVDCGTDQYRTQALLYSSMLVQAYQAANVHLKVSDMRAAVERNNPDGSVDVLIALRISVSNDQQQNQETGYRLRVRMAPTDGTYKISKLDQVTK